MKTTGKPVRTSGRVVHERSLSQWLSYIESVHKAEVELGLSRVREVGQRLQCLHFDAPVIMVAGSNGKGTTIALLAEIYCQSGYRTASYTSPHLLCFNERIQLNQQPIDDQVLCDCFSLIEQARGEIALTFFEYTTLAALLYFKQAAPDVLLLEVGLGGRLDAVNCVDADCAVITTISLEHQQWLGDTREAIASEKAGIMRAGKPLICGELNPPDILSQRAAELHCPAYFNKQMFFYDDASPWTWWTRNNRLNNLPPTHLPRQNAATALMVVDCMQPVLPVNEIAIRQACQRTQVPARCQSLSVATTSAMVLLDVAHNMESCAYLAEQLRQRFPCRGRRFALFSMLADKDIAQSVQALQKCFDVWAIAPIQHQRAASLSQMQQALQQQGDPICLQTYDSLSQAFTQLCLDATADDQIIVFGSFYAVGEVLEKAC